MTASNGIRTENKIKRLAAAVALAVMAMLGISCLSPARADAAGTSDGNLVIDVPTTVPCALMADGTVVSPSEWNITTSGNAYIASASASGFPANVEWSARTTDLAATQTGSVEVAGTGDTASVSGPSDPANAALATTARFEWSFSKLDAGKNSDVIGKAASGTAMLGSVTFTFAKPTTAFAVYSADDNSLTFYKRANVPAAGQMFEGKTATEVYEGVEKASYTTADGAPWAGHAAELASVTVADEGIAPVSTAYWFTGASKLRSVSLAGLDTSKTTCMDGMFQGCSSLESLDLSAMSTRRVASMTAFLGGCDSLAELSIGSEFAWVGNDCYPPAGNWKQGSTGTDYAESQIPANKTDKYTRAKTAFAVYSADDQSLTFYKRLNVPAAGGVFEGKTTTGVYTGFETDTYGSSSNVPWSDYRAIVKTVSVADTGVAPKSTAYWFYYFPSVESFNLSKLDTSSVTSMYGMFMGCKALATLDVSSFNTSSVTDMGNMFYRCESLTTLDLTSFDTREVKDMNNMFYYSSALTALNVSSFETANVKNMNSMFCGCKALATLDVSSFDTSSITDMGNMFDYCRSLTSLDVSSFDTSNVVNMKYMFHGCGALTSLDVSAFNTANVKNMNSMFRDCYALASLDLSTLNTSSVTDMGNMFGGCGSLTSLDLSSFDTSKVTSMACMFYSCNALASLDLSSFDTTNATSMGYMFGNCKSLKTLDLSSFDTGKVANMSRMFDGCGSLTSLDLSSFDTTNVTNMSSMFENCKALTSLDLSSFDTGSVTDMDFMFYTCSTLQKVAFGADWKWVGTYGYLPTPSSTYIAGADGKWYDTDGKGYAPKDIPSNKAMTYTAIPPKKAFAVYSADDDSLSFYKRASVPSAGERFEGKAVSEVYTGCETETYNPLDVPWWRYTAKIASVTVADAGIAPVSTAYWFMGMKALSSADISRLDTRNIMNMGHMFQRCNNLTTLDLSSFDTRNVTDMSYMFMDCNNLTTLDLSSFDTGKVTNMEAMFSECGSLTSLDLSSFDTGNVTETASMFSNCNNLATLDLSSFDTRNVTRMGNMIFNCNSLASLDLSSFDTRNVADMGLMFSGCAALQKVAFGADWQWVGTNGYLPTPNSAYIASADGKWYDADGNGYAPEDIPSNKAMTYTAVAPKKAFAVYSADDDSLDLYKRAAVPAAGEQFEGKTATEIYEGVEKASYTAADGAPWAGHADELASVTVADAGISPVSTAYWFKGASKLKSVSLAGLDTSQTTCMDGMFQGCLSLDSLDLSAMSTRRVASMTAFLGGCDSLAELSIGSEFAWVGDDCYPPTGDWKQGSTGTDYSQSDIPANKTDKYTRTKIAFAVYSADDQSLTFYKRPVAPAEGAQFLGKTASKVFTGFETGTYSPSNVPWAAYRSNVKAVTVADDGIAPTSTARWFYLFTNAASFDLSKLDTRNVTDMSWMFYSCQALTALDVSSFGTGSVTSMLCMFSECVSLTSLDLSSFDTGGVTDMRSMFQDCNALTALDISSFDTGSLTNAASMFSECVSLERISLGTGFKWVGWNCYPRAGNWESSSTGKVYSQREIPSGVADTYVFKPNTKASTAVNAASDPVNVAKTGTVAASANKAKDESATQKAAEGKPSHEAKPSKEDAAAAASEGVEKTGAVKGGE